MKKLMILVIAGLALAGCEKREKKEDVSVGDTKDTIPAPENEVAFSKQCYLQVTSRKIDDGDRKTISDSIIFNIEKREGDSIWGVYHWKPAEKDKKIATYKGTIKGSEGHAIANSHAEGMNYNEEVIFTITNDKLAVKFGEMAEGKDGIWYYKDKNNLSEQVLTKIDCK